MKDSKKRKRLRSVILVGAVGAIACGGKAEGDERSRTQDREGDGDEYVDYGPVGQPPDYYVGTGGWVGAIGTGGIPIGTGGVVIGTGGGPSCPTTDPYCIGVPGEPPISGGTTGFGGMGGDVQDAEEDELVGLRIR